MSEFSVLTGVVEEMSARLGAISGGAAEFCGQLGGHVSAAAQTPVDGALGGLMGHWAVVLPRFGLAGERFGGALRGAAGAYGAAEGAVFEAAGGSGRG
jgi:hypothetical protein